MALVMDDAAYALDPQTMKVTLLMGGKTGARAGSGAPVEQAPRLFHVLPALAGSWMLHVVGWFEAEPAGAAGPGLMVVNTRTAATRQVALPAGALPQVSTPDGERVAFAELTGPAHRPDDFWSTAPSRIVTDDLRTGSARAITTGEHCDRMPIWAAKQGRIIFTRNRREIWAVSRRTGEEARLWAQE